MKKILIAFITLITVFSCQEKNNLPEGLFAEITTNKGVIVVKLDYDKAPLTVANFITLAEGNNEFVTNPNLKGRPFFNSLRFHRVIEDFMIQTGDPLGTGSGDAGYKFDDEITDMLFDKAGVMAMANNGPATNSSQFFITHTDTPWLNGKHTIFGHVFENGMENVNKIQQDDYIETIKIIRNGEEAKKFDAVKIFSDYMKGNLEKNSAFDQVKKQKVEEFTALKAKATKTASGLQFVITQKSNKPKPAKNTQVFVHYAGFLENGTLFDASIESVAKAFGKWDAQRSAAKQYQPIPFTVGQKEGLIPGFIEGIEQMSIGDKATIFIPSNLGYGAQGAGNVIPPNANIIFQLELSDKM